MGFMPSGGTLVKIGLGVVFIWSAKAAIDTFTDPRRDVQNALSGAGVTEGVRATPLTGGSSRSLETFDVQTGQFSEAKAASLSGARSLTTEGWCPEGQLTGRILAGAGLISGVRSALGGDDVSLARGITVYDFKGNPLKSWDTVGQILEDPGVHVVPNQVVCVRKRSR